MYQDEEKAVEGRVTVFTSADVVRSWVGLYKKMNS
jgi:hypothetical protein